MPTVHEILANAPRIQQSSVNLANARAWWNDAKSYEVKPSSTGISMDCCIVAALMWRITDVRRIGLPTIGQQEQFIEMIRAAQNRLNAIGKPNAKIAGIHSHIINNWG